ncbi:MAG: 2-amino-4-hydroxy-6-hydroxymethyldihydropteridine diphosphokinase [Candidatus Eutrophobiaceae bacterium]
MPDIDRQLRIMDRAYIGLGSNLSGELPSSSEQLRSALDALKNIAHSRLLAHSSLYRSAPVGVPGQPPYINAVALLETQLSATELLWCLQHIERTHGRRRERGVCWGARTLDLDLLLYGEIESDNKFLTLPHPFLAKRNFVLVPLAEISPDLRIPGYGHLADLLAYCPDAPLQRL